MHGASMSPLHTTPRRARAGARVVALSAALTSLSACPGDPAEGRCEAPLVTRHATRAPLAISAFGERGLAYLDQSGALVIADAGIWSEVQIEPDQVVMDLAARAADDLVLLADDAADLYHYDGAELRGLTIPGLALDFHGADLTAGDDGELWAVGHSTDPGCAAPCAQAPMPMVLQLPSDGAPQIIDTSALTSPYLSRVGAAEGAVFVLSNKGLHRLEGGAWATFPVEAAELHVAARDDVILVGFDGVLRRFDGASAEAIRPPAGEPGHGYSWTAIAGFGAEALVVGVAGARDGAAFALSGRRLRPILETTPFAPIAAATDRAGGYLIVRGRDGEPALWGFECLDE